MPFSQSRSQWGRGYCLLISPPAKVQDKENTTFLTFFEIAFCPWIDSKMIQNIF